MNKKLVFTGGHHTSALEVAKALKIKGWEIVWFGHKHSMWNDKADSGEYREVTTAGIKFYDLLAGKFYRTYNPLKLIRIPFGFIQAMFLLLLERPDGIVSFGGYLAVPTVIMGWVLGIKSVTHEQTLVTGWANKLISHFVSKIAVSWPSSLDYYPKQKVVLVGLPLRPGILKTSSTKSNKPIIYITGGKQGSHVLNKVIFSTIDDLTKKYTVIHQTGTSTVYNDFSESQKIKNPEYSSFNYDSQQGINSLVNSDIVVSRAGAHTIYELAVLGRRSVLVPIPWVSHHEQDVNADMLVKSGIAIVLSENKLKSASLFEAIEKASKLNPVKINLPTDATDKMVNLIEDQLK